MARAHLCILLALLPVARASFKAQLQPEEDLTAYSSLVVAASHSSEDAGHHRTRLGACSVALGERAAQGHVTVHALCSVPHVTRPPAAQHSISTPLFDKACTWAFLHACAQTQFYTN